jgi:hypothetical protein
MTRPHRNESDRRIVVNGHEHIKDLIIRPDRVVGQPVEFPTDEPCATTAASTTAPPPRSSSRRPRQSVAVIPPGARAHGLDVGRHGRLDSSTITR